MLFKKKPIVVAQTIKDATVLEVWSVKWEAHRGVYHNDVETYKEFFTNEEDAKLFITSLKDSARILRYTCFSNPILKKEE